MQRKRKADRWQAVKFVDGGIGRAINVMCIWRLRLVKLERAVLLKLRRTSNINFGVRREDITTERKVFVIEATSAEQRSRIIKAEIIGNIPCTVAIDSPILRTYNSERRGVCQSVT